jgi:hypothetical protein
MSVSLLSEEKIEGLLPKRETCLLKPYLTKVEMSPANPNFFLCTHAPFRFVRNLLSPVSENDNAYLCSSINSCIVVLSFSERFLRASSLNRMSSSFPWWQRSA